MTAYIAASHYRDGVDGFILVSSDSDYWGLIDTIRLTAKRNRKNRFRRYSHTMYTRHKEKAAVLRR